VAKWHSYGIRQCENQRGLGATRKPGQRDSRLSVPTIILDGNYQACFSKTMAADRLAKN
jgi:hypothetical protein